MLEEVFLLYTSLEKTRPFFDALTGEIERIFQRGGAIRSPYVFCGDADDSDQSGTYAYLVVTAAVSYTHLDVYKRQVSAVMMRSSGEQRAAAASHFFFAM